MKKREISKEQRVAIRKNELAIVDFKIEYSCETAINTLYAESTEF
jgi:hypothetical protein